MANVYKSRSQSGYGDINPYQFPGKWESTNLYEDPNQVENFYRNTLKDFSPDVPAQSSDAPRRDYLNNARLTLRHTGTMSGLDPENPDLFLGFTDRDPRGYLLEPNGEEWKRQSWARKEMFEPQFKNDADWSVPSQGVHPNTKYAQMRATLPWFKSRFRNFETSKTGWHNGGVIEIPHASNVDKVCAQTEKLDCILADMELKSRQHKTTLLSNNFNMGYRITPSHKFKVAEYGKLYRATPMMDHVSQLTYISPDQKLSQFLIDNPGSAPKANIVIMSAHTSNSAAAEARKMRHLKGEEMAKHLMGIAGEPALEGIIRGLRLSDDIMKVLGYVEHTGKFSESMRVKRGKTAEHADDPEKIRRLTELLHAEPANVKLQISETIKRIQRGGLTPAIDTVKTANSSIVNPKIIEFMTNNTRSNPDPEINGENNNRRLADETRKRSIEHMPMYVPKRRKDAKVTEMMHLGEVHKDHRPNSNDMKVVSYKTLKEGVIENNRKSADSSQNMINGKSSLAYKHNDTHHEGITSNDISVDHSMFEHKTIDRRARSPGGKYTLREMDQDTLQYDINDM